MTTHGYVVMWRRVDAAKDEPFEIAGYKVWPKREDAEREAFIGQGCSDLRWPGEYKYRVGQVVPVDS